MRVTIVNLYYPPDLSPTGRLAASLAAHRAGLGDEVTVITSNARYACAGPGVGAGAAAVPAGPRVLRVGAPVLQSGSIAGRALQYAAFCAGAFHRLARLPRQDVVVCMTTPPYAACLAALHRRRHAGERLVLWNMDCYPEILEVCGLVRRGGLAARALRRLNRWLMRRVDHVVCLDEAMRAVLERSAPPRGGPAFSVIPTWEPAGRFAGPGEAAAWDGYARAGLSGRFVVLYLGNAGWGHEFGTVLAAAGRLRDEPVSFLFVGGGAQHGRIREEAARSGLGNVHVHPYVPEDRVASVLAGADLGLIVLADDAAGVMSPSKLQSYLAMGLPVVYVGPPGSNADGAIRESGAGAALRQGDDAGVASFIMAARADPGRLAAMRAAARRAFAEAYCDRAVLPRFDRVIEGRESRAAAPDAAAARGRAAA